MGLFRRVSKTLGILPGDINKTRVIVGKKTLSDGA